MNRKFLALCIFLLFLIISVGIVSAENEDVKQIKVRATGDMPSTITVSLLCDGKVVDTATLSQGNSWSTTFKVNADGDYRVVANENPDYSMSVSGSADSGFVVNSKQISAEKLSENADDLIKENNSTEITPDVNTTEATQADDNITETSPDVNTAEETPIDLNITVNNLTENRTNEINITVENKNTSDSNNINVQNKIVKKEDKKPVEKKENKTNKVKLRNTGLPLTVLVIAAFAAIFIPITRRK